MNYITTHQKPPLSFPSVSGAVCTFNSQFAGLPLKAHEVAVDYTGSAISGVNVGCDNKYAGFIAFNQLMDKDNYPASSGMFTNNGDGTWTADGTATSTQSIVIENMTSKLVVGHKYFVSSGFTSVGSSSTYEFMLLRFKTGNSNLNLYTNATIAECGFADYGVLAQLVVRANTTVNNLKFIPQVIDLTAMFGSTKADEIYNMEQQTPGSGVAYFRSLFPDDYYAYNAGTLTTVSAVNGVSNSFIPITFPTPIYGGSYDCLTGIVTSDKDSGGGDITPTYQQTATANCETSLGQNNIFADTGDTTLQYIKLG